MFERYRHLARLAMLEGEGGGGGEGDGKQKVRASDVLAQYSGDATRMAERLADVLNDNYGLRRKRDDLQIEVTTLTSKQAPEGAVVLTGDAAKAYEAYAALGKPEEVVAAIAERDTLRTEVTTAKRDGLLRDAAQAAGYKFSVLKDRAGDLPIELREVEEDGKKVSRPFVKPEAGGEKPLADYAAEHWADYLPALTATQGGTGQQQGGGAGVPFPAQQGGGGKPANVAQSYVANTYKGPPQPGARS